MWTIYLVPIHTSVLSLSSSKTHRLNSPIPLTSNPLTFKNITHLVQFVLPYSPVCQSTLASRGGGYTLKENWLQPPEQPLTVTSFAANSGGLVSSSPSVPARWLAWLWTGLEKTTASVSPRVVGSPRIPALSRRGLPWWVQGWWAHLESQLSREEACHGCRERTLPPQTKTQRNKESNFYWLSSLVC